MPRSRPGHRPLLIAAEGLDGAGKSAQLDLLARWLERKGRSVAVERWEPSRLIESAAVNPRLRASLTTRVAALLGAAEAARRVELAVQRPLSAGSVVLADRYAWTAIAREVARGLDPGWVANLYRFTPVPDLVLYFEQSVDAALGVALGRHAASTGAAAISSAFGPFLARMVGAYEWLIVDAAAPASADRSAGPWRAPVVRITAGAQAEQVVEGLRAAVRPLLDDQRAVA
jgi:thymidylate kinase